eukprot:3853986-Amphidinium_carterae.2
MTQSRAIESVENFMTFKRKPGESSDSMIVRFEETCRRATQAELQRSLTVKVQSNEVEYRRFLELLQRHLQRKERSLEGKKLLNFAGDKHSSRPQYPAWETTEDFKRSTGMRTKCGSTRRSKHGTDNAQKSSTTRKKTRQLTGTKKKNTPTHTHLGPTEAETTTAQDESEAYLAYLVARREWKT